MKTERLSKQLAGEVVSHVAVKSECVSIHFESGAMLVVEQRPEGITAELRRGGSRGSEEDRGRSPTRRQREYLEFIKRYTNRYGVAPAESDIQRHFLVSAPSVNQMIRTLEAAGFIARSRNASGQASPRSIRILIEL